MKKLIAIALLVITIVTLCACEKTCEEHTFEGPSCEEPKTCTVCGLTEGSPLKHNWMPANCENPRTCVRCELVDETAPLHNMSEATCEAPATCVRCDITEGEALGHKFTEGTCSVCGAEEVVAEAETEAAAE